jgi:hypothetical protein
VRELILDIYAREYGFPFRPKRLDSPRSWRIRLLAGTDLICGNPIMIRLRRLMLDARPAMKDVPCNVIPFHVAIAILVVPRAIGGTRRCIEFA